MNIVMNDFEKICEQIKIREKETYGYNQIEDLLLNALNFIKIHADSQQMFIAYFIDKINGKGKNDLVYGNNNYFLQVIQFCMRELQWPEIKEAALKRKNQSTDWRIIGTMDSILEVYETSWPDDELYMYYSKEAGE